jgi:hypothetical protein
LLAGASYSSKELQMMGFFNTGQGQSGPGGDSNVGSSNSGISANVDLGLGNISLPSVDAEIRVGDVNLPGEGAEFRAGDLNLATVNADVSLLSGECDGSGLDVRLDLDAPNKLLDVDASGLLEVTVGADNATSDCSDSIHVEALNGDHLLMVQAPGTLDATIGGSELGQILGGLDCSSSGSQGDGIEVEVVSGEHVADAHVPGVADVAIGSGGSAGLLHGLDDIASC